MDRKSSVNSIELLDSLDPEESSGELGSGISDVLMGLQSLEENQAEPLRRRTASPGLLDQLIPSRRRRDPSRTSFYEDLIQEPPSTEFVQQRDRAQSEPIVRDHSIRQRRKNRDRAFTAESTAESRDEQPTLLPTIPTMSTDESEPTSTLSDRDLLARARWFRINRRFQTVISMVALLFSIILFVILIAWVVLTSAYVVSFGEGGCSGLKRYYWLVTLQLLLDVFRADIMRFAFQWDSTSSERIPTRVILYNVAYLIYALMVLRHGILNVYRPNSCSTMVPDLFNASFAFVTLSITAWTMILLGYLLPFCVVAIVLTWNGYNPADDYGSSLPVFPTAPTGVSPECLARLHKRSGADVREDSCVICQETYQAHDVLVETPCGHLFHESCCREWLGVKPLCPICRTNIPEALGEPVSEGDGGIPMGPTGRPIAGVLRMVQSTFREQQREPSATMAGVPSAV